MTNEIKEILDKCTPFLFGDEVDKLTNYITNLQEEIEDLKADYGSKAQVERDILQDKINKATKEVKELYEMAKEQDSENVNLIDRLELILKKLRGKDNESN